MYYVYLLKLNDDAVYTGSTPNIKNRLEEHRKGYCISTRDYRPVKLVWYGAFENKKKALEFEKYLKKGSGQAFRNKRLT